jgi:hypothetical protein
MHGETMEKRGGIGKREARMGVSPSAVSVQWKNYPATDGHE